MRKPFDCGPKNKKKEYKEGIQKNFTVKLVDASPTRIPFACQMSTCHRQIKKIKTKTKKTIYKRRKNKQNKYSSWWGCACAEHDHKRMSSSHWRWPMYLLDT